MGFRILFPQQNYPKGGRQTNTSTPLGFFGLPGLPWSALGRSEKVEEREEEEGGTPKRSQADTNMTPKYLHDQEMSPQSERTW